MFKELIVKNKVLVIGDFMLDSYWFGNVSRISPEAPVQVFQKRSKRSVAGGAANVAANLIAAGKNVIAASVIGKDNAGEELKLNLDKIGCDTSLLQQSDIRKSTEKTRILAQNNQQLLRIDDEEIIWLREEEENRLVEGIRREISGVSAIILSDYMKGILTNSLCQRVIDLAEKRDISVFCDVKDPDVTKYSHATLVKPNLNELAMLSRMPVGTNEEILKACRAICNKCENDYLLVTLGSKGMALYQNDTDTIEFTPSEPREVYDVCGAGDTVISYLVACVSSGIDIREAVIYANKAAGIKVGKVGTSTVSLDEMEQDIKREKISCQKREKQRTKVYTVSELLKKLHNTINKKIVFTNGCFDIIHAGHVMYLQKAAECGDVLIVGVNSDESVRRLKGLNRPINNESDRLAVLSGLQSVTYLVVFDEDTPENLIKTIKPDVLVKGADYEGKYIAGAEFVKEQGGKVVLIPMLEGHSTTNIIEKSRVKRICLQS